MSHFRENLWEDAYRQCTGFAQLSEVKKVFFMVTEKEPQFHFGEFAS